jgi:Protein of unknown function (DUF998)
MNAAEDDLLDARRDRLIHLLLACGTVWPPVFLGVVLVEGATRPAYDAIRLPLSLLALTDAGWTQTLNFILSGCLAIAFAVGVRLLGPRWPRAGAALLALVGVGLIGAGLFTASPGGGYPPGVRAGSSGTDLHDVATLLVFGGLIAAASVFARWFAHAGRRGWAGASFLTAGLVAIGFVLMIAAFSARNDLSPVGGLIQRVTVAIAWTWLVLLALHMWRAPVSPAG